MGKYFGTDGIRGIAGSELNCDLAFRAGAASACVLGRSLERKPLFIIGRDTRISGDMITAALIAGLTSGGADVIDMGVLPTPAIAYFTANNAFVDSGVVISASHNPYEHNGIKLFGASGYKLRDEQENEIEALIDDFGSVALKTGADVGIKKQWQGDPAEEYARHLAGCGRQLDGLRVLIDCANGAASKTAPMIFSLLGCEADFIACTPNGININDGCGSTHLGKLSQAVKDGGYDLGIAFDGDADRCLMIDEHGDEIDGDRIIGALAAYMQDEGKLRGSAVVTVMSNLGLLEFLRDRGITSRITAVGDRYVLEDMLASGSNIGGEQSGHVIMTDYCTTGDGEMTAVQILSMIKTKGMKASDISRIISSFPQIMINVEVRNDLKKTIGASDEVKAIEEEIRSLFGDSGRILIRPSGTEAKVRVMVEGKDKELVTAMAHKAADVIRGLAQKA